MILIRFCIIDKNEKSFKLSDSGPGFKHKRTTFSAKKKKKTAQKCRRKIKRVCVCNEKKNKECSRITHSYSNLNHGNRIPAGRVNKAKHGLRPKLFL